MEPAKRILGIQSKNMADGTQKSFGSMQEAIDNYIDTQTTSKIFVTLIENGSESISEYLPITRWKLKDWPKLSFETVIACCPSVYHAKPQRLFWIRYESPSKRYQLGQVAQDIYDASTIVEVLTTEELLNRYQ